MTSKFPSAPESGDGCNELRCGGVRISMNFFFPSMPPLLFWPLPRPLNSFVLEPIRFARFLCNRSLAVSRSFRPPLRKWEASRNSRLARPFVRLSFPRQTALPSRSGPPFSRCPTSCALQGSPWFLGECFGPGVHRGAINFFVSHLC